MVAITTPSTPAPVRPLRLVRPVSRPVVGPTALAVRVLVAGVLGAAALVAVAYLAWSEPIASGTGGATVGIVGDHVVAEGETMWSIAREVAPAGEAAAYVERLVAANGASTVEAGQVLVVPRP